MSNDPVILSRADGEGSPDSMQSGILRSFASLRMTCLLILLAACASSAPPPMPLPNSVPAVVIGSFCSVVHSEGLIGDIRVVKTTQPIITSNSMQALAARSMSSKRSLVPPDTISVDPLPVEIPQGSCVRGVDSYNPERDTETMLLQFSVPFHNPFAGGAPGVLVRLSLANESASWYWIPIAGKNGQWLAGTPMPLVVR